jgi:hypothetical protein
MNLEPMNLEPMNLEPTLLFGIASVFATLVIAFLFLRRRRVARRTAGLVQTTQDLRAEFERLGDEMAGKIAELEDATNKLKLECAAANIQLVSLKAQTDEMVAAKAVLPRRENTWVRRENPSNISIIPTAIGPAGGDTWVRDADEPKTAEQTDSVARLATLFAQGNAVSGFKDQRPHKRSPPK